MNGTRVKDKWDKMSYVPEQAAIGNLHLSFEYHKTNLNIRVWQITDLLLPPPQISMIESIYVRSYLIPDPSKKTNRQTEDVKVEPTTKDGNLILHGPSNGIQHIITPSSFRFDTPLLYLGVTHDIVAERSLQLEVYMTQKQTHKTYLMAMVHLPLSLAVHKHLREKYPLIPCMNHTIPNSMRVYSARDFISQTSSPSWLNQSLSKSNSFHSKHTASLSDKASEKLHTFMKRFSSLELSDSDDNDDGVGSSIGVRSSLERSATSLAVTADEVSLHTDDDDMSPLDDVRGHNLQLSSGVLTNRSENIQIRAKKKIIPNEILEKSSSSDSSESSDDGLPARRVNGGLLARPVDDGLPARRVDDGLPARCLDGGLLARRVSGKFTVIKVEETIRETGEINPNQVAVGFKSNKEDTAPSQDSSGKKRIIPNELLSKISTNESLSQDPKSPQSSSQLVRNNSVYVCETPKDCLTSQDPPKVLITNSDQCESAQRETSSNDTRDEITEELVRSRLFSQPSETGSAVNSRPETPVWDFYDFAAEEQAGNKGEASGDNPSACYDEASKALGTLQESLLKLSRGSQVLDTCKVVGPVLPTVMIDDFEMDQANNDNSEDDTGDNSYGSVDKNDDDDNFE